MKGFFNFSKNSHYMCVEAACMHAVLMTQVCHINQKGLFEA